MKEDGSYIELKSSDLKKRCEQALENIYNLRDRKIQALINEEIAKSKKGIRGWWRRLWGKPDLTADDVSIHHDDWFGIKIYAGMAENIIKGLLRMSEENKTIYISRGDYTALVGWE